MKSKTIQFFWIGFTVAAIATAVIYWLLRNRREILTGPVIVKKDIAPSVVKEADDPPATRADNLSIIKGVGPAFAQRFNEAGIYTFEQLAQTTPENIREIIGTSRGDSNEWIEEARVLSTESDPEG